VAEVVEVVILETEKGRIIGGAGNTKPRRIPLMPVASRGDEVASCDDIDRLARVAEKSDETVRAASADDKSIHPEATAIPAVANTNASVCTKEPGVPTVTTEMTEVVDVSGDLVKTMERRRLLRDIDVAEAMREHLAATNPELNAAEFFLYHWYPTSGTNVIILAFDIFPTGHVKAPGRGFFHLHDVCQQRMNVRGVHVAGEGKISFSTS